MATVFADTFYFIALLDSADAKHVPAVDWSRQKSITFLTTEYVLMELGNAFCALGDREEFAVFHESVRSDSKFQVVVSSATFYASGINLYRRRRDKEWSLTDCTSFVAMKEHGVRDALTGDKHFEQAGFSALLK